MKWRSGFMKILPQLAIILLLALGLCVMSPGFFTTGNISNMLVQQMPYLLCQEFPPQCLLAF